MSKRSPVELLSISIQHANIAEELTQEWWSYREGLDIYWKQFQDNVVSRPTATGFRLFTQLIINGLHGELGYIRKIRYHRGVAARFNKKAQAAVIKTVPGGTVIFEDCGTEYREATVFESNKKESN